MTISLEVTRRNPGVKLDLLFERSRSSVSIVLYLLTSNYWFKYFRFDNAWSPMGESILTYTREWPSGN